MKTRIISLLRSNRHFAVSFVLVLVAVAALSVMSVNAQQCRQWEVTGDWAMVQSNGFKVTMDMQQSGTNITGTASYPYTKKDDRFRILGNPFDAEKTRVGKVSGNIVGNDYYAEVTFDDGGVGIYRGTVNAQGRIEGTGYPRIKPNEKSTFFSTRSMTCKPARIVNFGKPKVPAPQAPVNTTPAATRKLPDAPYLIASQNIVKLGLGQAEGTTVLSWDAGADHPYAEIWVRINGGDETKVLEKGKGSMPVQIRSLTRYTYILTDDGVTLATINITAKY